jgi:hypothetical protein
VNVLHVHVFIVSFPLADPKANQQIHPIALRAQADLSRSIYRDAIRTIV